VVHVFLTRKNKSLIYNLQEIRVCVRDIEQKAREIHTQIQQVHQIGNIKNSKQNKTINRSVKLATLKTVSKIVNNRSIK
jgi:DNA-binding protein H-NS